MEETQESSLRKSFHSKEEPVKQTGTSKGGGKSRKCGILKAKRENHGRIGKATSNIVARTRRRELKACHRAEVRKEPLLQWPWDRQGGDQLDRGFFQGVIMCLPDLCFFIYNTGLITTFILGSFSAGMIIYMGYLAYCLLYIVIPQHAEATIILK